MSFGGAVKLTGESEYKRALQQITQNLKEMASEMTAVSSRYSANDKSIEALTARSQVLNKQYNEQQEKLKTLKAQYDGMVASVEKENAKHAELLNTYNNEKAKLDELAKTVGTTSDEYKEQQKKVADLANEVAQSTKNQDANAKSMSQMRTQINLAEADCNNTAKAIDELGSETEESGKEADKAASGGWTVFKDVISDLASTAIKAAASGLKKLGSALVGVGKQAVSNYSEFEQLEGGVKKIFGDEMAKEVIENANNAFAVAGMSANRYMENVTKFSATLMQGLGEDTSQAAKYADMALRNMSDNANTFGTDIASIENAYQGFAKDNFTMLDNLRLGYGGTAGEMARLINESGVLGDEMEVTAKTVKDVPFHVMIQAIDETQKRLNISKTTVEEAKNTIQGSAGAMRAAWQNLLTGMADSDADFETLVGNFSQTATQFLKNMIPRIQTTIKGIAEAIPVLLNTVIPELISAIPPILTETLPTLVEAITGLVTMLVNDVLPQILPVIIQLVPQVISSLITLFVENIPALIDLGVQLLLGLLQGIVDAIPDLIAAIPTIIEKVVDIFNTNFPAIISLGIELLLALVDGILKALPDLIKALPKIINVTISTLLKALPLLIDAGVQLLTALVQDLPAIIKAIVDVLPKLISGLIAGLMDNLPDIINAGITLISAIVQDIPAIIKAIVDAIPEIISGIVDGFIDAAPEMLEAGEELIKGLWQGIKDMAGWIGEKIKGFADGIVDGIKGFFGIHSPSTLFRDEIGENLALGIGEGFSDEMRSVTKEMNNAIPTDFDINASVGKSSGVAGTAAGNFAELVAAFKEALAQMKVELDDYEMGQFVDKTVTRLVYN